MNKFVAVYTACSLLVLLIAGQAADDFGDHGSSSDDQQVDDLLESELELKKMIAYVTPLMSIFTVKRKRSVSKRSADYEATDYESLDEGELVETARARGGRRPGQPPADRNGYGEYSAGSSYGYSQPSYGCCEKKDDLLPILALSALSLLLLYLIAIATTTTTAAGRRRRSEDDNDNIIENNIRDIGILTLHLSIRIDV